MSALLKFSCLQTALNYRKAAIIFFIAVLTTLSHASELSTSANNKLENVSAPDTQQQVQKIIYGSYPFFTPNFLTPRLKYFADYVEEVTKLSVKIEVATSYEEFLRKAREGQYDLAYAPSHFALDLIRHHNFQPLLTSNYHYQSIIISKRTSDYYSINDLAQTTIAIPNPYALVTRAAQIDIRNSGNHSTITYQIQSTHDRTVMAVLQNKANAGVISSGAYDSLSASMKNKLKVIHRLGDYPDDFLLMNTKGKLAGWSPIQLAQNYIDTAGPQAYQTVWGSSEGQFIHGRSVNIDALAPFMPPGSE